MPKALRGKIETCAKKYAKLEEEQSRDGVSPFFLPRQLRCSIETRVGRTLFTLWCRMMESYRLDATAAYPSDTESRMSFIVADKHIPAAKANTTLFDLFNDENEQFQGVFGSSHMSIEAMIFYLHYVFADVDAAAWVIAFCIIDKLQLRHSIEKYMERLCNSSRGNFFWLHLGNCWRSLFVAFSLALKWHVDYKITLKYMLDVLPSSSHDSFSLHEICAQTEWRMFHALDYDVSVRPDQLLQLLEEFLTLDERECIISSITHETALGRL
ncbi:hypothetical protein C3747_13g428 [Trypanosoma cruzi]|uniref:Uncharacterized protein n=2 Tax=Trypanosoma cruzi TaxID=5693 RepID=Q4CV64_TRYCC|nr:hypothetical protein, conserved [Trypanosoma cruzi]EAN84168.1 hypothetical protein, conserved [Trypanosoma cruzi]KAF8293248.1 hypothetical protein TcYC6_0111260 [Trypanosoma cruzi]PWV18427.1 hypothetical protein C3747_13g428 [Trypanosoma cruzi]|eukprot:XP_806019.1 hypothetical protein [Trypanosoma cruzi strain CL Brener]